MALFKYKIKAICDNCKTITVIKIPKGITIKDFLISGDAKCSYCKCNKFSRFFNANKKDNNTIIGDERS